MTDPAQTLQTLANLDPAFPAFAAALPPQLTQSTTPLPPGLARQVLALVQSEQPESSLCLKAQAIAPPARFAADPLATAGVMSAILFLLRAHIKIEHKPQGGWHLLFDEKAMDSDLLKQVMDMLKSFLGRPGD